MRCIKLVRNGKMIYIATNNDSYGPGSSNHFVILWIWNVCEYVRGLYLFANL